MTTRVTLPLAVLATLVAALAAPGLAHAGTDRAAEPGPRRASRSTTSARFRGAGGGAGRARSARSTAVIAAGRARPGLPALPPADDLGGFRPAPIGALALVERRPRRRRNRRPRRARSRGSREAATGEVQSFAFVAGARYRPPDNGRPPSAARHAHRRRRRRRARNDPARRTRASAASPTPTTTTATTTAARPTTTRPGHDDAPPRRRRPRRHDDRRRPRPRRRPRRRRPRRPRRHHHHHHHHDLRWWSAAARRRAPDARLVRDDRPRVRERPRAAARSTRSTWRPATPRSSTMTHQERLDRDRHALARGDGRTNRLWDDLELGVWETNTAPPTPAAAAPLVDDATEPADDARPRRDGPLHDRARAARRAPATPTRASAASIDFHWYAQA